MGAQFRNFTASELYCPKCGKAMPVREKLLLILPSGELYEYLCSGCGGSLGQRTVNSGAFHSALSVGARARSAQLPPPPARRALPR